MHPSSSFGHSPRSNPFNNDEMSLSSELDDDTLATSSVSCHSSIGSDGSGDVSLAELGLTEDYFAHPKSLFGMSSAEELEGAIENCKKMIIEANGHSERQKKLVNKLIQLKMKLQELKEPSEVEPKVKLVLGHKLRKRKSNSIKHYCECCNNLIWGMLQAWYRCKECGFNCHYKCVNMVRRKCVATDANITSYILRISPEKGLSSQTFNCMECKNPISIIGDGKEEARLCDYSGHYYCPQCHWNDLHVIPARVMHNWDFTPCKVSRQSYQILLRLYGRPLLNVQEVNPLLFNYVEELADIRKFREDILLMKEYFVTCNNALELKLLLKLSHRQHFVDGADIYSLKDLVEAQDQVLFDEITHLRAEYAKHIKLDCPFCQGKGFICEICVTGEVLFPFDFGVSSCTKCKAVFHRDCFTFSDCPRCERLQKKKERIAAAESEGSDVDFYEKNVYNRNTTSPYKEHPAAFSSVPFDLTHDSSTPVKSLDSSLASTENSERKRHDSSLQSLTETSYTDYAVLGFTGSGKNQNSLPTEGIRPNHLDICLSATTPSKAQDPDKGHEYGGQGSKSGTESNFRNFDSKRRELNGSQYPVRHKFDRTIKLNSKYMENPITGRRQRDEASYSDLVRVKGQLKSKKDKHEITSGTDQNRDVAQPSNGHPGKVMPNFEDPFNQNKNKGSEFILDAMSAAYQGQSHRSYNADLDPFNENQNPESRIGINSSEFERDMSLDLFGTQQKKGRKFIDRVAHSTQASARDSQLTVHPSYDPKLDPFSARSVEATKVQSRSSYNPELNPFQQNSRQGSKFKSGLKGHESRKSAGNAFGDDYDDSKNPFS